MKRETKQIFMLQYFYELFSCLFCHSSAMNVAQFWQKNKKKKKKHNENCTFNRALRPFEAEKTSAADD